MANKKVDQLIKKYNEREPLPGKDRPMRLDELVKLIRGVQKEKQ